ncbi:MAG: hypothetical protein COA69_14360 [Robiginitomaculum sp.]|nr:MAG: hypothetical protein COA69_14360 [Robiginitomaculum sp.]
MRDFVSEGRVDEHSMISNAPESGFFHAIAYDAFHLWNGSGQSIATASVATGAGAQTYQQPTTPYASHHASHSDSHLTSQAYEQIEPTQSYTTPSYTPEVQASPSSIPEAVTHASYNPYAAHPAQRSLQNEAYSAQQQTSVFLVMAEIRSEGAMGFLKALQSFGTAQRIGDTVWLLRSAHEAEHLRNALSQTLSRQDRLFILDSSANKTAWFNIGADLDKRIRELWNDDED